MRALPALALGALCMLGCGRSAQHQPQPTAAAVPAAPPNKPFVAPRPWQSKRAGAPAIAPPDLALQTWHVLVDQYEPHQTKTPVWQPLPAQETVEVQMPEASAIRCVAQPLEIEVQTNDFDTELEAWLLARNVLCSGDGFRTWSAFPHRVRLRPDGVRVLDYRSDGWLSERAADGTVRNTVVSLRAEAPRRDATTGPPQILPTAHTAN